ncbi:MAG: DUF4434 domain-containing protein [bacterium]
MVPTRANAGNTVANYLVYHFGDAFSDTIMTCPALDRKITVGARTYWRLVLPHSAGQAPCSFNGGSFDVLLTWAEGPDAKDQLLDAADGLQLEVYLDMPAAPAVAGQPWNVDVSLRPAFLDWSRRVLEDYAFRHGAHPSFVGIYQSFEVSLMPSGLDGVYDTYGLLAPVVHTALPGRSYALSPYWDVNVDQGDATVASVKAGFKRLARLGVDLIAPQDGRGTGKAALYFPHQPVSAPGVKGEVGCLWPGDRAELRLVRDGVWYAIEILQNAWTETLAVVDGERLKTDLSRRTVIHNAALSEVVTAVDEAWQRAQKKFDGRVLIEESARQQVSTALDAILRRPWLALNGWTYVGFLAVGGMVLALANRHYLLFASAAVAVAVVLPLLFRVLIRIRLRSAFDQRFPVNKPGRAYALEASREREARAGKARFLPRNLSSYLHDSDGSGTDVGGFAKGLGWTSIAAGGLEIYVTLMQLGSWPKYAARLGKELAQAGNEHLLSEATVVNFLKAAVLMPLLAAVLIVIGAFMVWKARLPSRALCVWGMLAELLLLVHMVFMTHAAGPLEAGYLPYVGVYAGFPIFLLIVGALSE